MENLTAFRTVPKTGVIYVMSQAKTFGYRPDDPEWTNFGQGQPETTPFDGDSPRITQVDMGEPEHEYAPVVGIDELRSAVADHYNRLYRHDKASKYTAENVCICGGGRAALTRIAASLDAINLGHFLPDYTAYEELLELFRRFNPIPILLDPSENYTFPPEALEREIVGRGLSALLFSNPCNPTGKTIAGKTLAQWVELSRELDCTMIVDEFYSHYVWDSALEEASAARYVDDVDRDPIVLVNGLTKNFRYPGWRVSWTVAPKAVIERLASAGSFLDGGGSRPLQNAAVELLEPERVDKNIECLQREFRRKRDFMVSRLQAMGIEISLQPEGTFYVWADVSSLPGIEDGTHFFNEGLKNRFICVPGEFFDVNPGRRRVHRSRFQNYVRFSFGPKMESLERGLDRMALMLK